MAADGRRSDVTMTSSSEQRHRHCGLSQRSSDDVCTAADNGDDDVDDDVDDDDEASRSSDNVTSPREASISTGNVFVYCRQPVYLYIVRVSEIVYSLISFGDVVCG